MKLKELLAKRAALASDARTILDKAQAELRDLTAEESELFDKLIADADKISDDIKALEEEAKTEERRRQRVAQLAAHDTHERREPTHNTQENVRRDFSKWCATGRRFQGMQYSALRADDDTAGGFLLAPQQVFDTLVKAIDDTLFMRQIGTVLPPVVGADSIGAPSLDADPADADWTSEIQDFEANEDTAMKFGKRELTPHLSTKLLKVSLKLLSRVAAADSIVVDRLAYKFRVTEEKAFLVGTGANQPLGVFTAHASGITTARDITTAVSLTVGADDLIDMYYSIKQAYGKAWLMHRDMVKVARKLKSTTNEYLWQPGLNGSQQETILGAPIYQSEYAPNDFGANKYVAVCGDFSYYWIAQAAILELQRLVEKYALTNQVGFISRMYVDGMPVLAEAFARLKIKA